MKRLLYVFLAAVVVLSVFLISLSVSAGTVTIPGYSGTTQECCGSSTRTSSTSSTGPVYMLRVHTRAWYLPGQNQGPLYCKSNIYRTVFNPVSRSTGNIVSNVFSLSYLASQHTYQVSTTSSQGNFYTSDWSNSYASYSYWATGGGRWPSCDSSLVSQ